MSNSKTTAKSNFEKINLQDAIKIANELKNELQPLCSNIIIAGSIRRQKQEISDLDLILIPHNLENFLDEVKNIIDYEYGGSKKVFGIYKNRPINLFITNENSIGSCLYQCTGPAMYNIRIRQKAKKMGFKLNEYGLFDRKTNEQIAGNTEESIFECLNLEYIEPHLRKAPSWMKNK